MKKCLRLGFVMAGLAVIAWAQAPDQAPSSPPPAAADQSPAAAPAQSPAPTTPAATPSAPESSSVPVKRTPGPAFPRIEWFAGYSFAQAGFFNAGHWAQLNGWNASFDVNVAHWLGFVFEGSEYFGDTKIPTAVPAPFPPCVTGCPSGPTFNAHTREYNFLVGAQFPYRKHERWTPFGELLVGHGGLRGDAFQNNLTESEVSSGLAAVAGAGADYKINERFGLRFKADYLGTRNFKQTQDNLRLSVGVVIRSVHKKKRTLEEDTDIAP
ncbi:MAG: autotransporter outer membrane beta-barrel domain-containing protein [Terriglobales bacterium]